MTGRGQTPPFAPSGFFVLRTPLLPFDELAALGEGLEAVGAVEDPHGLDRALARDRARVRERLRAAVSRPELRDALFVASPDLDEAFDHWTREPDSRRGRRLEAALVAYFSRAAARATPFGLFAGCTTGTTGPQTSLRLPSRAHYQRHSRLDMDYLWALSAAVERDPRLRAGLTYRPNSSLYEAAGRLHLAEARFADARRSYHLVAVDKSPHLTATLERAEDGATLGELAAALVDGEITRAEADEYVAELVDSQLLVSDLRPGVTGDEPIHGLVATLAGHAETAPLSGRLDEARLALEKIDAEGPGVSPDRYRAITAVLDELPARPELSRLVQVDLVKPGGDTTLGSQVLSEISRGVRVLHQLAPARLRDSLSRFREAFRSRYETREVPLAEALDEETGIGFEVSDAPHAGASPLLAGLPLGSGGTSEGGRWTGRDGLLLQKLVRALQEGAGEVSIEAADLERLATGRRPPVPDAFHVMAAVAAESEDAIARGAFRVLIDHVAGPSGATMLGRFCHADPDLLTRVEAQLHAEEARRPEPVFAEIVHLPEGRIGNILCRPVLRDYEIPYLGRSGAPTDRQIPVSDLLVSVRGDRVVLRSRRLGCEVVPRLTTAHNYSWRSLGLYRFLCRLQTQDVAGYLAWDWGPLSDASFLPRVVSGRVVLSRARWNLAESDVQTLGQAGTASGFAAVQRWRADRRLPRHVALSDGDNQLLVDLDDVLSVEALAHQIRGRRGAVLVEMFPGPDELCASGPEGRFVHEVIVPFVRTGPQEPSQGTMPGRAVSVRRRFPPGSEWLYAKLYAGAATADQVLTRVVGPVVESAVAAGDADRWFFIRYSDPDWHLRIRVHGEPGRLAAEVRPRLEAAAAASLDTGQVWRVQFDTYEREVERYGGDLGIELAERVFHADSDAVLAILRSLPGEEGLDLRWRLALRGIDLLFDDLGLSLEQKRSVAREAREGYGREFGADGAFRGAVGRRYRTERTGLEALFDPGRGVPSRLSSGLEALHLRSLRLAPLAADLRRTAESRQLSLPLTEVAASYAHMHVNRLLRSAQRAQELVLYEMLDRVYSARAGRLTSSS
ncbi:lantibiotic dehydratase [Geodermatophilus sp. URMC 61]|uniref:lantibiotic dehydratase n=1 Tax=Geodermatophilus sp. URMC 61 TaxID=3423411 RepID=UPI00406CE524